MKETNLFMTIGSFSKDEFDRMFEFYLREGWLVGENADPDINPNPTEINYGDNLPKYFYVMLEKAYGVDVQELKIK